MGISNTYITGPAGTYTSGVDLAGNFQLTTSDSTGNFSFGFGPSGVGYSVTPSAPTMYYGAIGCFPPRGGFLRNPIGGGVFGWSQLATGSVYGGAAAAYSLTGDFGAMEDPMFAPSLIAARLYPQMIQSNYLAWETAQAQAAMWEDARKKDAEAAEAEQKKLAAADETAEKPAGSDALDLSSLLGAGDKSV